VLKGKRRFHLNIVVLQGILTYVLCIVLKSPEMNARMCLKVGRNCLFQNPYLLMTHLSVSFVSL